MRSFDLRLLVTVVSCSLLPLACKSESSPPQEPAASPPVPSPSVTRSVELPASANAALELLLAKLDEHGLAQGEIVLEKLDIQGAGGRQAPYRILDVRFDARIHAASGLAATQRLEKLLGELRQITHVLDCRTRKTEELDDGIRALGVTLSLDLPSESKQVAAGSEDTHDVMARVRAVSRECGLGAVDIGQSMPERTEQGWIDERYVVSPAKDGATVGLSEARRFFGELERFDPALKVTSVSLSRRTVDATGWSWKLQLKRRRPAL